MQWIQEYFVAANNSNPLGIDESEQLKTYIDLASSSQMALLFTNS